MRQLIEMDWLVENEYKNDWEENRIVLSRLYNNDKQNIEYYLRAINECWYVLVNWHFIKNDGLKYMNFKFDLIKYWNIGYTLFNNDERFIWMVGNMVTLFPELFTNEIWYEYELINKGKALLEKGRSLYPNNAFIETIYNGLFISEKNNMFNNVCIKNIVNGINDYFPGDSEIEIYYKNFFECMYKV